MSTEIVLKSADAKKLLPDIYKGKVNLSALAVEINEASALGNTSLSKLKEVTSGGWISHTWNTKDINLCVHDFLVAIATLSKAQIALQAITADISQATLSEQKIIAQQQQQLASQQNELAAHSAKIEELIILTDQSSFIEVVADKIKTLQSQYEKLLDEIEHAKVDLVNANIKTETHQKNISQLKVLMIAVLFAQVFVIAFILFYVMR